MQRKIIKLGHATFVASLPSKWTKKFNLQAGDSLDVAERANELIFSTMKHVEGQRKTLDITHLDSNLVKRALVSSYTAGYDEVFITFEKSEIQRIKEKSSVSVIEFVQNVVAKQLIGFEILEQKSISLLLKDLGSVSEDDFSVLLRRVFLLLNTMGTELLESVTTFDKKKAEQTSYANDTIARFVNYCVRILNKKGHVDFQKLPVYYYIIMKLREISYTYKFISSEFQLRKHPVQKEVLETFSLLVSSVQKFYELYYKYDNGQALAFLQLTRTYYTKVNALQYHQKTPVEDVLLISRLSVVNVALLDLTEALFSLQL